jgi:hypothetical protein
MSIPLVQEATKDAINTSIIAIKRNIERINMLLGLVDNDSPDLSGFATKQELQDAVTELQPVDEVTVDNMQSVTSNATFKACSPNYSQKQLIFDGITQYENNDYIAPDNGIILASGWGSMQSNNYIIFSTNGVTIENQGNADEAISLVLPVRKNDSVRILMLLASNNYCCYFVPYN